MASADSCPVTAAVARCRAIKGQWHAGQVSPDKSVNCRYTTAAFTVSPESDVMVSPRFTKRRLCAMMGSRHFHQKEAKGDRDES